MTCQYCNEKTWDFAAFVEMKPKSKARPRFTKSGHTYTDKATVEAERYIQKEILSRGARTFDRPVEVEIICLFKVPQKLTKPIPRIDVDNAAKLIMDALQPKVIIDDKLVQTLRVSKRYSMNEGFLIQIKFCDFEGHLQSARDLAKKMYGTI